MTNKPFEPEPKPKLDESRLLTDEELDEIAEDEANWTAQEIFRAIAKDQLAKDLKFEQARVERIKKELENQMGSENYTQCYDDGVPQLGVHRIINDGQWQEFWKKEGIE